MRSGKEAMAVYWKGNSLFTKRLHLGEEQSTSETNFVLNYRNNTSPVPKILPLCQFLASSMTFVGLSQIELWLDNHRLLALTKLAAPGASVTIPKTLETKTAKGFPHRICGARNCSIRSKMAEHRGVDAKGYDRHILWARPILHGKGDLLESVSQIVLQQVRFKYPECRSRKSCPGRERCSECHF